MSRVAGALLGRAGPTWVTRAGIRLLLVSDLLVVARHAPEALAPAGLAYSLGGVLHVIAFGALMGTLVLASRAIGAGRPDDARAAWRSGMRYGLGYGIVAAAAAASGPWTLPLFGQDPAVAAEAGLFVALLGVGLPAHYVFVASAYYGEALARPGPVAAVVGVAFGVNALANALVADAGATAVIATTVALRWIMAVAAATSLLAVERRLFARRHDRRRFRDAVFFRRLGAAAALALAADSLAFALLAVFAGWLGPHALATYTLANTVISAIFTVAFAMGVVTGAAVADAHGAGAPGRARQTVLEGMGLTTALMAALGLAAWFWRAPLAGVLTAEPAIQAAAAPLMGLVALAMLGDGGQTVVNQALRGLGDVWTTTWIHAGCYVGLLAGGGLLLGIALDGGVPGLLWSVVGASLIATAALTWRFVALTRVDPRAPRTLREIA